MVTILPWVVDSAKFGKKFGNDDQFMIWQSEPQFAFSRPYTRTSTLLGLGAVAIYMAIWKTFNKDLSEPLAYLYHRLGKFGRKEVS